MIGFGAQTLLKGSQIVRSVMPARPVHIIAAPAKNKVHKGEFILICAIFAVTNFAYPTYVIHELSSRKKASLGVA